MLSIDINKELERMAHEWGYTEKEATQVFRNCVRFMWGKSKFKIDTLKKASMVVKNTNPRSMGRYPTVTKYTCNHCKQLFGSSDIELDHLVDENTLVKFEHAENFLRNIFFTSPAKLQVLCKDKKKKVKGKSELVSFGCHTIKTYASRYGCAFEEALLSKQIIELCKNKQKGVDFILSKGVQLPHTHKAQKELINKLMRDTCNNDKQN